MKNIYKILPAILLSLLMAFSMLSCGSGGGSGGSSGGEGPGTGSVAILLTDAPTDDFLEINLTIIKIELLSDNGHVTVFSADQQTDPLEIDLLDLKNETELILIKNSVPAITYNKIRLTLSQAVLIDLIGDPHVLNLPGNNKLDLNPQDDFSVKPGEMLALQVDLDANNAIHVVISGNNKTYHLRPVVFIDIIDAVDTEKIMRITGTVHNIYADKFKLCDIINPDKNTAYDKNICVYVYVTPKTSFFSAVDGEPISFQDLKLYDIVTAIGFYKAVSTSSSLNNNGPNIGLDAVVVEVGKFLKLKGTIRTVDQINGQFTFEVAPDQGYGTGNYTATVLVQNETKIYTWDGDDILEADFNAIITNRLAEVDGIMGNPDELNSSFILIDIP
jgi:hypothetical protein